MRWVILFLGAMNVAYFLYGWLQYGHSQKDVPDPQLGSTVLVGSKVVLLREASTAEQVRSSNMQPTTSVADEVGVLCGMIGPLSDRSQLQLVQARLAALDIDSRPGQVPVEGASDYWVYLKPAVNREQALSTLRELQEKRIESFIIPEGDLANGVSLGVFDSRARAESRQAQLISLGYDALVRENPRVYGENWLVMDGVNSRKLSRELMDQLEMTKNGLELRKDNCSKVASLPDIK